MSNDNDNDDNIECEINVSITDIIMPYFGDGKRMQEKQQVFKAKHIVDAGSPNATTQSLKLLPFVLEAQCPVLHHTKYI